MLAFDHPLTDETRMPITRASAQLIERLGTARDKLQGRLFNGIEGEAQLLRQQQTERVPVLGVRSSNAPSAARGT
jgi:hypothetical protein